MEAQNSTSNYLLSADSICKNFGERQVLQDINLSISEGQIVTLIGPNGAGKTTLVRIILGLLQADSGSIFQRPDLTVGYMPQKMHIEPTLPLTVLRFLQLVLKTDQARIDRTLIDLNISHLLQQQLVSISGGELQRVLLARALLRNPQILILDDSEPWPPRSRRSGSWRPDRPRRR